MADQIREALAGASAYLSANPAEARYTDSPATAVLVEGLRVAVRGAAGETLTTDMPSSVGGGNEHPSPGWFLRAAEASCVATLIAMRAAQLDVKLRSVEVTVDSESDDRGILGIGDDVPAGPISTRVAARLAVDEADAESLRELVEWAVAHCPVTDAVRRAVPMAIEVDIEST
ncbi:MAG TPA: OsmC family protein [Candidatus Limnocylindrales bacterium]|nr:OsmC family protein [Candidatus Limnocylindrales bacterium]